MYGIVHAVLATTINTSGRVMSQSKLLSFFGRGLRSSNSLPETPAKRPKTTRSSVESSSSNEGELSENGDGALLRDEEHGGTGSESNTAVSGMAVGKCNKHGMVKPSAWLRDSRYEWLKVQTGPDNDTVVGLFVLCVKNTRSCQEMGVQLG